MLKPRIVIMLGRQVTAALAQYLNIHVDRYVNFDYTYEKTKWSVFCISSASFLYFSIQK